VKHSERKGWGCIRAILALVLLLVAFCAGYLTHRNELIPLSLREYLNDLLKEKTGPPPQETAAPVGWWHTVEGQPPPRTVEEMDEALLALGYLSGTTPAPGSADITIYDSERASAGLNLYVSGHAPEAALMDMDGHVLHTWHHDLYDIWPDFEKPKGKYRGDEFWRRAYLLPNGDLLAIHDYIALVRLDKDSNIVWARRVRHHHDLDVSPDGLIYALKAETKVLPRINDEDIPIVEDFVSVLDPDGNEVRAVSILEAFENSSYRCLLDNMPRYGDLFHTNTVEVLDGAHADRSAIFAKGNVLVSILKLDTIAILDMEQERIVWAMTGLWRRQHQPTLLPSGNMLVFDNRGHDGRSKVIEFDPLTQQVAWTYSDGPETPFFSLLCGSCQRLPNGNTLITESDRGRAFEVTPDNTIVWEFYNPHRAGEQNELIATLFELTRLPADVPLDWLDPQRI